MKHVSTWRSRAALAIAGALPVVCLGAVTTTASAADCASIPEYRDVEVRQLSANDLGWTRLKVQNYFGVEPSDTQFGIGPSDDLADRWFDAKTCAPDTTFRITFRRFEESGSPVVVHWRVVIKCIDGQGTPSTCVVN